MNIVKLSCFLCLYFILSCTNKAETPALGNTESRIEVKTEEVSYNVDGKDYTSFVAYPEDKTNAPVVMVLPEWWGVNEYTKSRAKQLAELGYFAMAVDFFGGGKSVNTPQEAQAQTAPLMKIPVNAKLIFDAAKARLLNFQQADYQKIAVIGYCFGGAQALNMGRQERDLKGVVSFHGNLETGVRAKNNVVKFLVLNGAADTFVPETEIQTFKKEMDSAKINYKLINYPGAIHSFTNPASTEIGKKFNLKVAYNKEANEKSWQEMKQFLAEIFK